MERLAILDFSTHILYIDDVSEEELEKYNGEEQDYIRDNYGFVLGSFEWNWITEIQYFPLGSEVAKSIKNNQTL